MMAVPETRQMEGGSLDSSKRPHSFLSSVFSGHKSFGTKGLFETDTKSEKGFLRSVITSKQGLLTDLSSRLEAALSLSLDALDSDTSDAVSSCHATEDTQSERGRRTSLPLAKAEKVARRHRKGQKDRSVYGQPEISPFEVKKTWRDHSQESLDTVDSGQSLGNCSSLSAGATDYRSSRNDPFYAFRRPDSLGIGGSESGGQSTASLDSSDAESIPDSTPGLRPFRSGSNSSLVSWASSPSDESQPDDLTLESMEFMKNFVRKMFDESSSITFEEKSKFGDLCRYEIGRLWFARCVNSQRVHSKLVRESSFFSLVQHFAIALFECAEADDFSPAKSLMNMCFTFFFESVREGKPPSREYLFNYLKEQPIWRSVRFWNAAFFDAVQCERANRHIPTRDDLGQYNEEDFRDEKNFQENIFFGQLGTFTYNMYAFGLSKDFALEFLRKQCTIANLSKEHVILLRENIDRMYNGDIGKEYS